MHQVPSSDTYLFAREIRIGDQIWCQHKNTWVTVIQIEATDNTIRLLGDRMDITHHREEGLPVRSRSADKSVGAGCLNRCEACQSSRYAHTDAVPA